MRNPISADQKLAITLRFLATGESYESLQYQFRVHESTISIFIPEVCDVIWKTLKGRYMSLPSNPAEWLKITKQVEDRWQFPNCFGAADGKHIAIAHQKGSGSEFYNYKGFFSIVLLALVDHDYKFIFADVGCQGRISDGGVYRNCSFYKALESGNLGIPEPRLLPSSNDPNYINHESVPVPYVFVGDEAFPLGIHCLKPYSQQGLTLRSRVFNYRLSRFRRVTENAFGILASRFRIFLTKIPLDPDKAVTITLASLVIHNMLRELSTDSYTPEGFIDEVNEETGEVTEGAWREQNLADLAFLELQRNRRNNAYNRTASQVREMFADHFFGPGQVQWQWNMI
eukprot:TCONS_00010849-protein